MDIVEILKANSSTDILIPRAKILINTVLEKTYSTVDMETIILIYFKFISSSNCRLNYTILARLLQRWREEKNIQTARIDQTSVRRNALKSRRDLQENASGWQQSIDANCLRGSSDQWMYGLSFKNYSLQGRILPNLFDELPYYA
jgi:hypothetical protein